VTDKFGVGSLGLGSLPGVMDTMEMIRKAWPPIGLPANFAPTLDAGELDKRIADLKAVEQWLNVNLGMLRGTIQGLEVQRGTLAALDAFGQAFGEPGAPAEAAARALAAFASLPQAMAQAQAAAAVAPSPAAPAAPADSSADAQVADPSGTSSGARAQASPDAQASDAPSGTPVDFAAGLSKAAAAAVNPAAWWDLLRSQFDQVARAAVGGGSDEPGAPAGRKRRGALEPDGAGSRRKAAGAGATPARKSKKAPCGRAGSATQD